MASTLARNSAMRTSARLSRTSGVSAAGLRMSPASPPVQHTSTQRTPSAVYLATVPAPFDASSSGWACTASRDNGLPAWSRGVAAMRTRRYRTEPRSLTLRLGLRHVFLGALERPDLDPADVADAAATEPLPRKRRVVGERGVQLAGRQHASGPGQLHQAARQVDHGPVVIAFLGEDGAAGEPGARLGQELVDRRPLGET